MRIGDATPGVRLWELHAESEDILAAMAEKRLPMEEAKDKDLERPQEYLATSRTSRRLGRKRFADCIILWQDEMGLLSLLRRCEGCEWSLGRLERRFRAT